MITYWGWCYLMGCRAMCIYMAEKFPGIDLSTYDHMQDDNPYTEEQQ